MATAAVSPGRALALPSLPRRRAPARRATAPRRAAPPVAILPSEEEASLSAAPRDASSRAFADASSPSSSSDRAFSSASASASASAAEAIPPPTPPAFEPRADPAPAFASLTILLAFFVVNRRVAAAVERRRDRERAEEDLRRAKVRSLDGSADFDEVSEFASALDAAREEEAKAREVLAFLGADVRVRVPQPLGKPISEVVEEERRVSREIERRRRGARGAGDDEPPGDDDVSSRRRGGASNGASNGFSNRSEASDDARNPPGWMTAATGFALAILAWSAVGLAFSPDPALGPALTPEQIERQMEMR